MSLDESVREEEIEASVGLVDNLAAGDALSSVEVELYPYVLV